MTNKQKVKYDLFCLKYIEHRNGAQAAIEAGYAAHSARQTANKLLKIKYIADKISDTSQAIINEARYTLEDIRKERERIAFHKTNKLYDADWANLKAPHEIGENESAAINSVSVTPTKFGDSITIRTANKLEALRDLEKMYSDLEEKAEKTIKIEINNHGTTITGNL